MGRSWLCRSSCRTSAAAEGIWIAPALPGWLGYQEGVEGRPRATTTKKPSQPGVPYSIWDPFYAGAVMLYHNSIRGRMRVCGWRMRMARRLEGAS